jgi:hypothetical protein
LRSQKITVLKALTASELSADVVPHIFGRMGYKAATATRNVPPLFFAKASDFGHDIIVVCLRQGNISKASAMSTLQTS